MERFSTCVLPSPDSYDVVTSPFNACLSLVGMALQRGSVLAGTCRYCRRRHRVLG